MQKYTVKEVAEMLNTNPETVRRWIRKGDLSYETVNGKTSRNITDKALKNFFDLYPKYAKIAASSTTASILGGGLAIGSLLGVAIAQGMIKNEQIKNAQISSDDIMPLIVDNINDSKKAIEGKRRKINALEKEIASEQKKIEEMKQLLLALKGDKTIREQIED